MKRGFVTGKFYPPHKGHKHLIDTATEHADKVTVAVVENKREVLPGQKRARWIKRIHPNVEEVMVVEDIEKDSSQAWAQYTEEVLGYTPDVVFTSEDYGETWAYHLGCEHHLVDKSRNEVPISATQIRSNPTDHFEYLEPCVRAHFTRRVVVLGAASSGTTTLAKALAEHFQTVLVPEYGRLYASSFQSAPNESMSEDDFVHIARSQNKLEDRLARHSDGLLVCDTDSFATRLWHEHYRGYMSDRVQSVSENRPVDMYILTDIDIPFEQDGTRQGGKSREHMHKRFKQTLDNQPTPFEIVSGSHENRLKLAVEMCNRVLSKEHEITGTYQ